MEITKWVSRDIVAKATKVINHASGDPEFTVFGGVYHCESHGHIIKVWIQECHLVGNDGWKVKKTINFPRLESSLFNSQIQAECALLGAVMMAHELIDELKEKKTTD